jgi:uncharacterized lipoprotein YehR (DUF1307 family)
MENVRKTIGVIAIIAVIGFTLAGCDDGSSKTKFEGTWRNPAGSNVTFMFTGNSYTQSNNNGAISSGTFTFTETTITFVSTNIGTWTQGYTLTSTTLTLEQVPGRSYGSFTKQ